TTLFFSCPPSIPPLSPLSLHDALPISSNHYRSSRAKSRDPVEVTVKLSQRDPSTRLGMTCIAEAKVPAVQRQVRICTPATSLIFQRRARYSNRSRTTRFCEDPFGASWRR